MRGGFGISMEGKVLIKTLSTSRMKDNRSNAFVYCYLVY